MSDSAVAKDGKWELHFSITGETSFSGPAWTASGSQLPSLLKEVGLCFATWNNSPGGKPISGSEWQNRIEAHERRKTMKCQSDYDAETNSLLSQADQCIEEWWRDDLQDQKEPQKGALVGDEDVPTLIVKSEVRKRGLVEVNEESGLW
jgi:hypothetical protein